MSVESPSLHNGAEFRARPVQTTEKGTEVQSRTGNRIVDAANRVASIFDKFKMKRKDAGEKVSDMGDAFADTFVKVGTDVGETVTGLVEAGQEKIERGKAFMKRTGEKAVGIATATGEIAVGMAILGGQKAGEAIENSAVSIAQGVDKAKTGIANYVEFEVSGIKEALKDRSDRAKQRREERRARWAKRWDDTKEAFGNMAEKNQRRVKAARMAGRAALSTYKAAVDNPSTNA